MYACWISLATAGDVLNDRLGRWLACSASRVAAFEADMTGYFDRVTKAAVNEAI
jgi:hypothetical protein